MSHLEKAALATLVQPGARESWEPEGDSSLLLPHWYAAYTSARHEKRVAEQLGARGVEHFLPLYQTIRRWRNGRHSVELPLFPGYIFVRIPLRERLQVLTLPSVVRLVGFGGLPTPLPDPEMESLRRGFAQRLCAEPHPFLTIGRKVRIHRGPFEGLEGLLLKKKGKLRVIVSIEIIRRSAAVEVSIEDVEPLPKSPSDRADRRASV